MSRYVRTEKKGVSTNHLHSNRMWGEKSTNDILNYL